MILIGLTGGIASGKSTVSDMFKHIDIPVIDADNISRKVVMKGSPVISEIAINFGSGIINDDGSLNRKELGNIVFDNKERLEKLNDIIQPAIRNEILNEISVFRDNGSKICVVDIPLLFEFNYENMFDYIIVVYVNYDMQTKRLMERDSITKDEAIKRINSQISLEEKMKRADFLIDNCKTVTETKEQLMEILNKIYFLEDLDG